MAEKFSVLVKYTYLDIAMNANLSDEDFGLLMKAIINYDRTGTEPKFGKQNLIMAFAFIKYDLDNNKTKWEERVITNQNNGKKGGRPPKAQDNPEEPKKPTGFSKTQQNPNNPMGFLETHDNPTKPKKPDLDLDSGGDLDLGYDLESGGGKSSPASKDPVKPPPPFEQIKAESKAQGFFIDLSVAKKFLNCGLDPMWFVGPYSFLEFSAERVKKKYPGKNNDTLKPLFISAVKSWEDLREEYPHWREEQKRIAERDAKTKAIKLARENVPKKCQCGGTLNSHLCCNSCKGYFEFSEEKAEYIFQKGSNESLLKGLTKQTFMKGGIR